MTGIRTSEATPRWWCGVCDGLVADPAKAIPLISTGKTASTILKAIGKMHPDQTFVMDELPVVPEVAGA